MTTVGTISVDASEVLNELDVRLIVTGANKLRIRTKIGAFIVRCGARVIGRNVAVELEVGDAA